MGPGFADEVGKILIRTILGAVAIIFVAGVGVGALIF